jgi:hypothetical protein
LNYLCLLVEAVEAADLLAVQQAAVVLEVSYGKL